MRQIQITPEIAKQMHESGIESLKEIAELNFPELFKKKIARYEDLPEVRGYILPVKFLYPTKHEALSRGQIYAKLAQVRDYMNGEPLNDWADWRDVGQNKYVVYSSKGKLAKCWYIDTYHEWSFKTEELRDKFLESNRELLDEYYGHKKVSETINASPGNFKSTTNE